MLDATMAGVMGTFATIATALTASKLALGKVTALWSPRMATLREAHVVETMSRTT